MGYSAQAGQQDKFQGVWREVQMLGATATSRGGTVQRAGRSEAAHATFPPIGCPFVGLWMEQQTNQSS